MFSLNNVKLSSKYRRIQRLGQGNFADVILVEDTQTKQVCFFNKKNAKSCFKKYILVKSFKKNCFEWK